MDDESELAALLDVNAFVAELNATLFNLNSHEWRESLPCHWATVQDDLIQWADRLAIPGLVEAFGRPIVGSTPSPDSPAVKAARDYLRERIIAARQKLTGQSEAGVVAAEPRETETTSDRSNTTWVHVHTLLDNESTDPSSWKTPKRREFVTWYNREYKGIEKFQPLALKVLSQIIRDRKEAIQKKADNAGNRRAGKSCAISRKVSQAEILGQKTSQRGK